ncbi:GGDEF domain-containing protein [Marinobacter sp.]|uniref:GGDEF domain-containing protein n=1 Tax=Marinobacter sp. TaxID=50741 RepID=UPI003F98EC83
MPRPAFLLHILIILSTILCGLVPVATVAAPQPLTEGWEYRWGDLPFNTGGTPDWAPTQQPEQWHAIGFPSNPPDRNGRDQVWYRVTLPAGDFQEPVLYILSIDLITQVWLDGKNIYQYGTFDEEGRGKFEGWPWHKIALPEDYENKVLYFRVYSGYTDIGLWGEISIMDHSELMLHILKSSLKDLFVAGFSLLVAMLALIFSMLQGGRKTLSSIALFALASSVMLVAESQASLLIVPNALFWNYLAAGGYYLLPVALWLMLDQWLGDRRSPATSLIWKLHLGYVVGSLSLALIGVVELSSTYPPFDVLLLLSFTAMGVLTVPRLRFFSGEQKLLVLACCIFGALLVVDMAVAHGMLPWVEVPISIGLLVFSLSVVLISFWHYASTQQALQKLTVTLEQQVAERTEKAETLLQREQVRAGLLTFENEKSRALVDVIAQLQTYGSLNQAFHLLVEILPALCSPIKGMIYRRTGKGSYERMVSWGYGDTRPKLAPVIANAYDFPGLSRLISGSVIDAEAASRSLQGLVSFPINVEFASHGSAPESLLLLEGESIRSSGHTDSGAARLLSSLNLAVERIGVTLSGISLREELQRFSYEDALTGLKNRRYFDQLFEHEMAVALRKGSALSLLLLDIDHFKHFNDSHGHEAGDAALRAFAAVLESRFRGSDVVCRYGGEEFVVILPGSDMAGARERAEQLCEAARKEPMTFEGNNLGYLTISIGVAAWPNSTGEPGKLFKLADEALYRAKTGGRDNVEVASE